MKNERGQAMVLVVFAIIGLAAVIGLALDGGRLYQTRRQVQNAADAMALAGTRVLASEGCTAGAGLEARVCAEIVSFGQQNEVEHNLTTGRIQAWYINKDATRIREACVGSGVPNGTTGVEVTAQITHTTTFMRVVGQDNIDPTGNAAAMFGPVVQAGGGILPIGFPVQQVDAIIGSGNPQFTMFDGNGAICRRDGVNCPSDPPQNSQRGWLNFNFIYNTQYLGQGLPLERTINKNFSNNDLKGWAVTGCPHPLFAGTRGGLPPYYSNGDYISGDPGTRDVTRRTICTTYMNRTVYLPVFDYVYVRADMQRTFPGSQEPSLGWVNSHYYHIVGFLAATLDSCAGGGSNGVINGTFKYATVGEGQIAPDINTGIGGSAACSPMLKGVVLWK